MTIRQCVMLVGGAGTRLGALTQAMPKPMLPVAGKPFVEHLLIKAARHGFTRVLLLAGYRAEVIAAWLHDSEVAARLGLTVDLSLETAPLGTAGALIQARAALDEAFLLVNGDTWFDFDWRELADEATAPITVALRRIDVADRYETVVMEEDRIVRFAPRTGGQAPGLINGGAYRMLRSALPAGAGPMSLETQLLPQAAAAGSLAGRVFEGAFIDIGLPETLDSAQGLLAD